MSTLTKKASFNIIRYANCWEDADILLKALRPQPGSSLLSIGSAGDNSFSLLATDPEIVMAVDLSHVQLHLIELKKVAMLHMEQPEFLAFIGVTPSDKRTRDFEMLKTQLPVDTRAYWEKHVHTIQKGLIFNGKFERYFSYFRKWLLPLVHSRGTRIELFRRKNARQQETFYHQVWNNVAWKLLFRVFFSKTVMGKYGRDPEFLKQVNVPVSSWIFDKAQTHLLSTACQQNYFLRMIILGEFGDTLPHYLRPENYSRIKVNLSRLKMFHGYAEEALGDLPSVSGCNLSNIFEYMSPDIFRTTAETLARQTAPGCRMAYWNLMVPRQLSGILPETYIFDRDLSEQLTKEDLGFFYNCVRIDTRT